MHRDLLFKCKRHHGSVEGTNEQMHLCSSHNLYILSYPYNEDKLFSLRLLIIRILDPHISEWRSSIIEGILELREAACARWGEHESVGALVLKELVQSLREPFDTKFYGNIRPHSRPTASWHLKQIWRPDMLRYVFKVREKYHATGRHLQTFCNLWSWGICHCTI